MTTGTTSSTDKIAQSRERIWADLAKVAKPDSRFHWDFSSFIADFAGSDICAQQVRQLESYQRGGPVFITPDNSTEALRAQVMADERTIIMTTYGIGRGFLQLDPRIVPPAERRYAATLDGMDHFATPISLDELRDGPQITLLVTGGSAVSTNGVRFGKGHGYFDLEWAILSELGRVDTSSQIVDVVHDCQVVDETLTGEDHDVPVDWIATPTQMIHIPDPGRQPGRIRWDLLAGSPLQNIPPIQELHSARRDL